MSDDTSKIKLIVSTSDNQETQVKDRFGGDAHGMTEWFQGKTRENEIDIEKLKKNIEEAMGKIDDVLRDVSQKISAKWKLDSVSIGLSISAEGSVGIATAGVETSIEVSFSPKP